MYFPLLFFFSSLFLTVGTPNSFTTQQTYLFSATIIAVSKTIQLLFSCCTNRGKSSPQFRLVFLSGRISPLWYLVTYIFSLFPLYGAFNLLMLFFLLFLSSHVYFFSCVFLSIVLIYHARVLLAVSLDLSVNIMVSA